MTTTTTQAQLTLTHTNGGDWLLLRQGDRIVSAWACEREQVVQLVDDSDDLSLWDVQEPDGIELEGRPARVEDYGEAVVEVTGGVLSILDADLARDRSEYWDVDLVGEDR